MVRSPPCLLTAFQATKKPLPVTRPCTYMPLQHICAAKFDAASTTPWTGLYGKAAHRVAFMCLADRAEMTKRHDHLEHKLEQLKAEICKLQLALEAKEARLPN